MGLNTRSKVLAMALEDVVGTTPAGSMTNTANMGLAFTEATLDAAPEFIDDQLVRASFTPTAQQVTYIPATLRVRALFRGKSSGTDVPVIGRLFDSAGMRRRATRQLQLDTTASTISNGPFRHGEVITGGTSGNTAIVMHDWYDGTASILIASDSGGAWTAGETITGGSTGATAAIEGGAASTSIGYTWHPVTEPLKQVDIDTLNTDVAIGTFVKGNTSGAIGVVEEVAIDTTVPTTTMIYRSYEGSFIGDETVQTITPATTADAFSINATPAETYVAGAPLSARLYEDGVYKEARAGRTALTLDFQIGQQLAITGEVSMVYTEEGDAGNPTGISYDSRTSPLLQEIPITIATDAQTTEASEHTICLLQALAIQSGPQLSRRISACDASGIREQFVSGRQPTGSMNPEKELESSYAWLGNFTTGALARLRLQLGTVGGNMLLMTAPGLQFTQLNTGDRDGAGIYDAGFNLTGGELGNLTGATVTLDSLGSDNELVLTYFHTTPTL